VDGEQIDLTKMEYDIVEFLSMHPGQVFDRDRMYDTICGCDGDGDSRVITELIRRIRNKIAQYTKNEFIETVWGSGYKWRK
jgi:DNA-binding response OmpR family regulator